MGIEHGRGCGRGIQGRVRGQKRKPIRLELSTSTSPVCTLTPSGSDDDATPFAGRGGGLRTPTDFIGLVYLGRGPKILPPHKLVPTPPPTEAEIAAHMHQRHESYLTFANAASVLAARVRLPKCHSALLLTPEELFVRTRVRLSRRLKRDAKSNDVPAHAASPSNTCK